MFHRGDYNIPRRFSEVVGKLSDLLDQIIGEAKRLCLFWWLGHVIDLDLSHLIGSEPPMLRATTGGSYKSLQNRLSKPLDL